MIRISCGNLGSGKTACEVRELFFNRFHRNTYSNIITKGLKNNITLKPEMIITQTISDYHKNKKGDLEPVYKKELNTKFWQEIKEPINLVLDEAHSIINSRRSMTKVNIILGDWLALMRRILGENSSGYGELVLITQVPQKLDVNFRDLCTQVRYHKMWYTKICSKCRYSWPEHTDMPESVSFCPKCKSFNLKKQDHAVEIKKFSSIEKYGQWKDTGIKTYYTRQIIHDLKDLNIFNMYNTFQWDNLFMGLY